MIDRIEVLPGDGTVIRYGNVIAWAAPTASPALISFLAQSARNLSGSSRAGRQIADHIAGVLRDRDPEPQVAFAVVGPDDDGWASLLHGPVQAWDGNRWLAPTPSPGWLHEPVDPRPAVTVNHAGSHVPALDPDGMWDLEGGVVRGGGFVLVPRAGGRNAGGAASTASTAGVSTSAALATAGAAPGAPEALEQPPAPGGPEQGSPADDVTGVMDIPEATSVLEVTSPPTSVIEAVGATVAGAAVGGTAVEGAAVGGATVGGAAVAGAAVGGAPVAGAAVGGTAVAGGMPASGALPVRPPGSLDLTRASELAGPGAAKEPLPVGVGPDRPVAGIPVVAGVLCEGGHINRPGTPACVRCSSPLPQDLAYTVSGTRPGLGCLVIDDGTVWRLDSAYLVGSDPSGDPTVNGGMARPLRLAGDDVGPSHADIRLKDWDVQVIDRASASGTWVYEPGASAWSRLAPYEARTLRPGTHIAFGQRIATFVTPWVDGETS